MKTYRKLCALFLCLALCLSLLPAAALAEENSGDFSAAEEETTMTESNTATMSESEAALPAEDLVADPTDDLTAAETVDVLQVEPETIETVVSDPGTVPDNDELFAGYVDQAFLGAATGNDDIMLMSTDTAGDQLSGQNKILYDSLKAQIAQVAAGTRSSTKFTVPISSIMSKYKYTEEDFGQKITESNYSTLCKSLYTFKVDAIINALLSDCSYELYWYNKTVGISCTYPGYSVATDYSAIYIKSSAVITFYLAVASNYAGTETYTSSSGKTYFIETDLSKTGAVTWAANNAKQIVMDASEKTDYSKLVYYREQICALTSYNHDAAEGLVSYGDPWQLIYVFDGNPNTNVVCEGYAKAFQYLCEMTHFDSDEIYSITVTGTMRAASSNTPENHMWNVVHMPDGENYLVDVTNCDSGTVGAPDKLFLHGYSSGSASGEYYINASTSGTSYYIYCYSSSDTIGVYSASDLELTTTSYYSDSLEEIDHTWSEWDVDLSAGTRTRTCSSCGKTEICMIGDTDRDGTVDMKDLMDLKKYLSGSSPAVVHTDSADLDGDGQVTLKELLVLKKQLAGI